MRTNLGAGHSFPRHQRNNAAHMALARVDVRNSLKRRAQIVSVSVEQGVDATLTLRARVRENDVSAAVDVLFDR